MEPEVHKADVAEFEVVRAGAEDVELVVPLFDAYLQFYKLPSNEAAARRYLNARLRQDDAVIFLAREERSDQGRTTKHAAKGRAALGFTLLYPTWSSLSMRRWWTLNDLYVVPEARQRGVARALMLRARRLAEETGAAGLGLETATDNLPAQKLYEALGWRCDTAFYRYELKV
jgi:ribosomal protein S18 acetylase RimI-like enzyme